MNIGIAISSPCYRTLYPPTNPVSGRSPFHSETVIWNPSAQRTNLVTTQRPQPRDEYIPSTSAVVRTFTDTRTGIDVLRPDKTPMAVSRYSPDTIIPKCGPVISTQCPPSNFLPR